MSTWASLKNAIPKKKYRERSQPSHRAGAGFLEKKVDYKRRAVKYHKDQDSLSKKKIAAGLKNPEEFYHKMITLTKKGVEREDKVDKATVSGNKNLLNYHLMKIKKGERR